MFEFLRENVLCGGSDGCVPEREHRPHSRRPGEVISSQGGPSDDQPNFASQLPWDDPHRRKNTPIRSRPFGSGHAPVCPGSPLPCRSPRSSIRQGHRQLRKSFSTDLRDALGESFPCSGAAAVQDDALPGRGLCVSMQRGLGARAQASGGVDPLTRSFNDPREHFGSAGLGGASPLVPADCYAANVEDPLDRCFEGNLKQLNPTAARATFVRKAAPNEYEVDGTRVTAGWRRLDSGSREAYIFDKSGPVEPLSAYLSRAADAALARSIRPPFPNFLHPAGVTKQLAPSPYGSFYSRADASSFYGPIEAGSFYSSVPQPLRPAPKDPRIEAMQLAGASGARTSLPVLHQVGTSATAPSGAPRPLSPVMRTNQAHSFILQQGMSRPGPVGSGYSTSSGSSSVSMLVPNYVSVSG